MKSIVRVGPERKRARRAVGGWMPEMDTRVELIRALIRLGLEAVRKVFGHRHLPRLRTALHRDGLQQSGVSVA